MILRGQIFKLLLGLVLSLLVVLSSVGLLALAGFLICGAAIAGLHPATAMFFNYFLPAGGIRFFALLRIGSRYGERVITHDATFRILSNLRVWFYRKLEPLVPAFFAHYRAGDLLNRSVSDIDTLDQIYLRIFMPFVVAVLLSFLMFVFLHFFSREIAWSVFLGILSIVFVVSALSGWMGNKVSKRLQSTVTQYRVHVLDLLSGMKDLLLYGAKEKQEKRILSLQKALHHCQRRLSQLRGFSTAMVVLISGAIVCLALYFGIPLVNAHIMTAPILCLIVLAILGAFEVLMPLPAAFQAIGASTLAVGRLKTIAHEKPRVVFPSNSVVALSSYDIEFKHVDFSYHPDDPDHSVLENINLSIPFGAKQIIVGPSGAGKTSLLQLLARFYDPINGKITVGGQSLKNLSESDLRDTVSLVTQQDYIFNESVRDNLLIADPNATDEHLWNVLNQVRLADVLMRREQGLETPMGEFGQHFSSGQLRRFSIARALLRDTPIMMFDEPTEGLDDINANVVWELLLNDLKGHTVIVVTHRAPSKTLGCQCLLL